MVYRCAWCVGVHGEGVHGEGVHGEGVHASESYRHGFPQSFSRYLLSGVDFEKCNHDGRTPLHMAAAEGMNQ